MALVGVVGAAMLTNPIAAAPAGATPKPAKSAEPAAKCPASAPDAAAARVQAVRCKGRVEVESGRTETKQLFVNATGSLTSVEAAEVQRVRAGSAWVKPDPTLRRVASGGYAPVASAVGLTFSSGGSAPLVTVKKDKSQLALRWPGKLPAPSASGSTLTYAEVLPGVDLVVTAGVEGFAEALVVKSAAAAANPALARIRLQTETVGLHLKSGEGGSLAGVNDAGATVFGSGTPTMWDSSNQATDPPLAVPSIRSSGSDPDSPPAAEAPAPSSVAGAGSAPSTAAGPSEHAKVAAMPVQVTSGEISIQPDQALLTARDTKWPVYVDPAIWRNTWTMINDRYRNQSYWSYDRHGCPKRYPGWDCAKVGYTDEAETMTYRSMFQFGTSDYVGKHVIDAKLSMDLLHSWTCSDSRTDVHVVSGTPDPGTTWNNFAGLWGGVSASVWNSDCGDNQRRTEWNLTGVAQTAATQGWSGTTFGLKASDESNHNGWKKFDAGTAYFTVTYNSFPNAPDQLSVAGSPCVTGAGRPYVKTLTPELRARLSDPDGYANPLNASFWWWPLGSGPNDGARVGQDQVSSGNQAIVSIPGGRLTDGATYAFRAQAGDGIDAGQYSATCEFSVDATPPGTPNPVSSTDYPADGQLHGGAGVAGTFTFSPPGTNAADVVGYAYTLDTGLQASQATQVGATGPNRSASVSFTPPTDGTQTLRVWSRDAAGNFSLAARSHQFGVRAGAGPDAMWRVDEGSGYTTADASGHGNPLSLNGAFWVPGRGPGNALTLSAAGSTYAATAGPIATKKSDGNAPTTVRTDANFTVSAWVRLAAVGGSNQGVVISQDGNRVSAYTLGYSGPDNRWRFRMAASDTDNPAIAAVLSDTVAAAGIWTHLAASYDGTSHRLRLYVNGTEQSGSAILAGGFNASGAVAVGRARWNGANSDFLNAAVDDVRVYARTVNPAESEFTTALKPPSPTITFPNGLRVYMGQPLAVTFDAHGDTDTTKIRYGLDVQTMPSTVTLPTAGGQTTVNVTPARVGDTFIFAASMTNGGRQSDTVAGIITVVPPPSISGTVTDLTTGAVLPGATVRLKPGDRLVKTGVDGSYSFTGIDAGRYTLWAATAGSCGLLASTEVSVDTATLMDLQLVPHAGRFGYSCSVRPEPFVAADDSVLALGGENPDQVPVRLPFDFPFYGKTYSQVWVSTNATVTMNRSAPYLPYATSIPTYGSYGGLIAPFLSDLYIDSQASVRIATQGTSPNRRFVIEWRNATFSGASTRMSVELVIAENGDLTFNYAGLDNDLERGSQATVGIESAGDVIGDEYSHLESVLASGMAISFGYPDNPQPLGPVSLSGTVTDAGVPVAGARVELSPGDATTVTDAEGHYIFSGLEPNTYYIRTHNECRGDTGEKVVVDDSVVDPIWRDWQFGYYTCVAATTPYIVADQRSPWPGRNGPYVEFSLHDFPFQREGYFSAAEAFGDGHINVGWLSNECVFVYGPGCNANASIYSYPCAVTYDGVSSIWTTELGDAPNRRIVVEWRDMALSSNPTRRVGFEVIFDENGDITFNYSDQNRPSDCDGGGFMGFHDARDGGLTYTGFDTFLAQSHAVIFRRNSFSF